MSRRRYEIQELEQLDFSDSVNEQEKENFMHFYGEIVRVLSKEIKKFPFRIHGLHFQQREDISMERYT